ncbi:DHH family phosphoesterase [Campylobacter upsaliensis]|uniref:DHH family phosphoesterase n=1 Tax=Campylobacter upsaliensis TaxID=28080 RepID=UPI002149A49E|nr:DHH family phosphoesterase [Campylobacter upsaliensis]MCR2098905.1 DHH family phosphoesterase [Campylobacter upsaliensis]
MKIYHLSHTDLDGYACQYIVNFYFKDVKFYNSNYGKEINENFTSILNDIEKDEENEALLLISDLNLTLTQCEEFEKTCKEKGIKLLLLDHHQSGFECMQKYDWYFLDSSRCAAKIVYDFFSKICFKDENLERFVRVVNAVDIWLKDDEYFELGKVFLGLIASAKEINRVMFQKENVLYMFFLLERARKFIEKENAHILLDNAVHFIKKDYFLIKKPDDTLANLLSYFIVEKLSLMKGEFVIYYENCKGILTSNIGNTSIIGNDFLVQNPDFDFFIDVSSRKTLSFRANGKIDVSLMAKRLVGGGGHRNASGGLFVGFKESANYKFIKAQIIDLIKAKELKKEAENV